MEPCPLGMHVDQPRYRPRRRHHHSYRKQLHIHAFINQSLAMMITYPYFFEPFPSASFCHEVRKDPGKAEDLSEGLLLGHGGLLDAEPPPSTDVPTAVRSARQTQPGPTSSRNWAGQGYDDDDYLWREGRPIGGQDWWHHHCHWFEVRLHSIYDIIIYDSICNRIIYVML